MSLLSKWSSLGHKVAHEKTEPQNVSLLSKWSSLGHEVAHEKSEPQNVSLFGKIFISGVARLKPRNAFISLISSTIQVFLYSILHKCLNTFSCYKLKLILI